MIKRRQIKLTNRALPTTSNRQWGESVAKNHTDLAFSDAC
jgi:hypothetical protein